MSNVVSVPQEHPFRVQLENPNFFQFEPLTPLPSWTDFSLNYSKLSSFYTLQASLQHGLLLVRYPLISPVTCNFLIHTTESALQLLAPQLEKSSAMQNRLPPIHGGYWSKMVWRVICRAPFAQAHDLFFSLPSGTLQVSTIQRSTFQLCVPQVDIPEVSTLKISSTKVSSTEFWAFQVSLL